MAYLKYKELSREFNFSKKLPTEHVPAFITQYLETNEIVNGIYGTSKDTCVFTDRKLILFDIGFFTNAKKIHLFPYNKISSSSIEFKFDVVNIYFSYDSGYQTKIRFVGFNAEDKTELRQVYFKLINKISEK